MGWWAGGEAEAVWRWLVGIATQPRDRRWRGWEVGRKDGARVPCQPETSQTAVEEASSLCEARTCGQAHSPTNLVHSDHWRNYLVTHSASQSLSRLRATHAPVVVILLQHVALQHDALQLFHHRVAHVHLLADHHVVFVVGVVGVPDGGWCGGGGKAKAC